MPIKVLMPALSPTMTEGNLAKWLKKEGDNIKAGEIIAEIETDKATMEVEAVDEGVLAKIVVNEGSNDVPVNSLIAVILEEDEDDSKVNEFVEKESSAAVPKVKEESEEKPKEKNQDIVEDKSSQVKNELVKPENSRIFASPLAKRIAAIEKIPLNNIIGSGPHGRIVKADVLAANQQSYGRIVRHQEEYKLVPNSNMRKVIAKRLLESKQTVPHFYLAIECTMDAVLEARKQINLLAGDDKAKKLSVNDFVILAAAKALKEVPEANASWSDEAIMMYNNVNVSVAVAIDGGLITPVIKNADQKDIMKISGEMKDLAKRARENKLAPEEYQGGGFSISNLGMYGIKSFNAIVNPPQACILAVGQSSKRPVITDGTVAVATIMDVSISCDHRVVDGAVGAKLLAAFKKYIESPILLFVG